MLDVSAAFDTVDHAILLQRLSQSYGVSGSALDWFRSFVTGRSQTVKLGSTSSPSTLVRFGVPQGSVLGPLLYVLYTADVIKLVQSLNMSVHVYADDTQLYGFAKPSDTADLSSRIISTIEAVSAWMASNRLRLNQDKTQFLWFGSALQLAKRDSQVLSAMCPALLALTSARDLGVILDSELSFDKHVSKLSQSCYFQLRRLRTIRTSLSPAALHTLVHAFVCSRLDFCNSSLYGVKASTVDRLQSIFNAAARLLLNVSKFAHISAAIRDTLHWLPVKQRIEFRTSLLVRNCLVGSAPDYLRELCVPVATNEYRRKTRASDRGDLIVPRVRTERFGRRGFSVAGPYLWNTLPVDVRRLATSCSLLAFKRALKTYLFSQQTRHF